ncbi:hypothetical protein N9P82_00430 [bacterium]|jgi:20S proteasome subunit alpha 3|nr:hypothetical protein [bacterium]
MEAISHAGAAVGIRTNSGVVLAAEKKILSKVPLEASHTSTFPTKQHPPFPSF